jgi:hypothetical protein
MAPPARFSRALVNFSTLALLGSAALPAVAAPMPFPKPVSSLPVPLTPGTLVGNWTMYWGDTRYPITLSESGTYTCQFGAVKYVGSWGLDWEGRFWITESSRPQESGAWQNYAVRLKSGTLTGKIEVGAPGVAFRLEKRRPVSKGPSGDKAFLTISTNSRR